MSKLRPWFILSRHWQENNDQIQLRYWLSSAGDVRCWIIDAQESTCFIALSQLPRWQKLWSRHAVYTRQSSKIFRTLNGDQAIPVYSGSYHNQRKWVRLGRDLGLSVWEDDINPADRYLMERFLFGSVIFDAKLPKPAHTEPAFKVLSIDIETSWYEPGKTPDLYSVALVGEDLKCVIVVDQGQERNDNPAIEWVQSIEQCLTRVIQIISDYDPDSIIGWNVVDFDLRILQEHCDQLKIDFSIGRNQTPVYWRPKSGQQGQYFMEIEGRQVVDGPGAFRSAAWSFEDYSLETVSQALLGRGKKIDHVDSRVSEIEHLYRHDVGAFARYNIEDAQLVIDLFEAAGLWHFLSERCHLTGLSMDRIGGSSTAFNTVYMPRLHRQGYIASNVGEQTLQVASPGGFVMESVPGVYKNVLVLDFKSLYPSIIRTFLVDPLGLSEGLKAPEEKTVSGFLDARFHRTKHILPDLIDQLWQARDQAKAQGNAPMSQAIKIIMNSFYGVLGSHLCRFFDPRLASSITMRGQEILQLSRNYIEEQGYPVIYGDTDSVFVHVGQHLNPEQVGQLLAKNLNYWWAEQLKQRFGVESRLEIEFETCYEQFVMPTIRGTQKGSKKRYAGWLADGNSKRLIFKGLEAVRSDWTPLARQFQTSLYELYFLGQDFRPLIRNTVSQLKAGELDHLLVYRRRLRRRPEDYDKQLPPHVQAALLKRQQMPKWSGRSIEYLKTTAGWQPLPFVSSTIDYGHYIDKQLAPIAEALLHFLDLDFYQLVDDQMNLF